MAVRDAVLDELKALGQLPQHYVPRSMLEVPMQLWRIAGSLGGPRERGAAGRRQPGQAPGCCHLGRPWRGQEQPRHGGRMSAVGQRKVPGRLLLC